MWRVSAGRVEEPPNVVMTFRDVNKAAAVMKEFIGKDFTWDQTSNYYYVENEFGTWNEYSIVKVDAEGSPEAHVG